MTMIHGPFTYIINAN